MRVLFVCTHNAGRSQMAEGFVNYLASRDHKNVKAESAGTIGADKLNPQAVLAMAELGIDISNQKPKLLTQAMADRADRVITMGCGVDAQACPARFLATEDWGLDDPSGQPIEAVRAIRDQIEAKVQAMLKGAEK